MWLSDVNMHLCHIYDWVAHHHHTPNVCRSQMEAGVQRLSSHFTWPEFCDKRRDFHQDFVYNVTMFAATCGFPWSEVAQAAVMAKALFPKLDCQSARMLSLLFSPVLYSDR